MLSAMMASLSEVSETILKENKEQCLNHTCGVGDTREQLRQVQEPVAFPQLVSDLDNLVTELLAKGE